MKLFVWTDVLCDHSCGMVCILAHDLEEALKLWEAKYPAWASQQPLPFSKLRIVEEAEAFAVYGGG